MKIFKYTTLLFISASLISSCQKVITVDLNSTNPAIVVDGQLNDQPGQDTVKLSKTANYFGDNVFPKLTGASVIIYNDKGVSDTLKEVLPGVYTKPGLYSGGGTSNLIVKAEGKTYQAQSTMPTKILIDSLSVGPIRNRFRQEDGFQVTCHFKDPAGVANYYRLKQYVNDTLYDGNSVRLYSDKYTDGSSVNFPLAHRLQSGDVVKVELICLDAKTYDYYSSLNTTINGSATSVSPANPVSNMSNGALGYFGVFTVDTRTITVK